MFTCKIKKITKTNIKKYKTNVYDIIGLPNHNFVANDIVVHNCDESVRFATAAEWALKQNKELKKRLAQIRTKHLLFILCFPYKIFKLEKTYLDSFVNYWCCSGDTKILIKDNTGMIRNYSIKELRFKKNYKIASYNIDSKKIEYAIPKKCIKTKKNADVYEIELENGIKIKATKEHLFLTKNGNYKKLINLTKNDKLVEKTNKYLKIKKIKKLTKKEDVYDIIGVQKNHNFIANNIVVHNCDLYGRGKGAIFVKDRNPAADTWRIKDFAKLGHYTEFTDAHKIEEKLKHHPNFWTIIKYPKPPEWLYTKYINVREKNVYDEDAVMENVSREDIYSACMILALRDIMMSDTALTINRILLHIKNQYDITLTKQMIQLIIDDARQLVAKVKEQMIKET